MAAKGKRGPGMVLNGPNPNAGRKHEAVRRQCIEMAERLMLARASDAYIVSKCKGEFDYTKTGVQRVIQKIRERWHEEDREASAHRRAEAIRSLRSDMVAVRFDLKDDPRAKHAALCKYHSLLADFEGTRQPLQVNVDHRVEVAMMGVIANLTQAQKDDYRAKFLDMKRKAEAFEQQQEPGNNAAAE